MRLFGGDEVSVNMNIRPHCAIIATSATNDANAATAAHNKRFNLEESRTATAAGAVRSQAYLDSYRFVITANALFNMPRTQHLAGTAGTLGGWRAFFLSGTRWFVGIQPIRFLPPIYPRLGCSLFPLAPLQLLQEQGAARHFPFIPASLPLAL